MNYTESEELNNLALDVIKDVKSLSWILDCGITFHVLECEEAKVKNKKIVYADCRKTTDIYRLYCPYDFLITVYEPNVVSLSDDQLKVLLWHELSHIGMEDEQLYIRPHDFEDFKDIYDRFGLNWAEPGAKIDWKVVKCRGMARRT